MLQSKDIEWQIGFKKTKSYNILLTRDSLQDERNTQNESVGMERDFFFMQMEMRRKQG